MKNYSEHIFSKSYLNLIFEGKGKKYGAYQLRRNYPKRILKSLLLAIWVLFTLLYLPMMIIQLLGESTSTSIISGNRKEGGGNGIVMNTPPMELALKSPEVPKNLVVKDFLPPEIVEEISSTIDTTANLSQENKNNSNEAGNSKGIGEGTGGGTGLGNEELDQLPSFPGGIERMNAYIKAVVKYPEEERQKGIRGIVGVTFTVAINGKLENISISKSLAKQMDAEALKIIKEMPEWIPAFKNGKPVGNVQVKLRIDFEER